MTALGATSYSYDRNGNLRAYDGNTLSYDASGKWTGGTVSGMSMVFSYDAQGRRVSRTGGGARTDYWYDSTGLSLESGARDVIYQHGADGVLLSISSGGVTRNYALDQLGSITGLITTGGSLSDTYSYDPWGRSNGSRGTAYNPHRYTGTYLDGATGLYLMGARYYQTDSGRFTQQDPLPSQVFSNRYGYTGGDPVNNSDPSGLLHAYCEQSSRISEPNQAMRLVARGTVTCRRKDNDQWVDVGMRDIKVCVQWHHHDYFLWYDRWEDVKCGEGTFGEMAGISPRPIEYWCKWERDHHRAILRGSIKLHFYYKGFAAPSASETCGWG